MSLEAAIAANTAAIERLTAVLQSGAITPAPQPETAAGKSKTKPAATPTPTSVPAAQKSWNEQSLVERYGSVNDGRKVSIRLQPGDPEGTIYVHIPAHNTVAAIRPGDPVPSIQGAIDVDGDEYAALKVKYTPPSASPSSAAGAPSASPAATPAASTPAASTASSPSPATSALDGPAIVAKCQALHKAQGNDGLKSVLDKFGVTKVPELISKCADKFADIAAFIDAALAPPADANLFG